eukprot:COSAG02_NODE_1332_length_13211_cov_14.766397_6_plen_194_part_00
MNPEPEPEPEPELSPEEKAAQAAAAALAQRYEALAGSNGAVTKSDLVKAVPALEHSPFFSAVIELLVDGADTGTISKERFMEILGRFNAGSPLEGKLRGMFDMFRKTRAGASDVGSDETEKLYRDDVAGMMNALYATEDPTIVEVMVTGLMQALGEGAGADRSISWTSFKEACEQMEDLDTMLTLVWPDAGET